MFTKSESCVGLFHWDYYCCKNKKKILINWSLKTLWDKNVVLLVEAGFKVGLEAEFQAGLEARFVVTAGSWCCFWYCWNSWSIRRERREERDLLQSGGQETRTVWRPGDQDSLEAERPGQSGGQETRSVWRPRDQDSLEARRAGHSGGQDILETRTVWRPGQSGGQETRSVWRPGGQVSLEARRPGQSGGQDILETRSVWRPGHSGDQDSLEDSTHNPSSSPTSPSPPSASTQ